MSGDGRPPPDGPRRRGGGRGRAPRGDVRTAVMLVLAGEPMHGYQIMQAINERTSGLWRLSPGAVYPTIAQLADEGLVNTEADGGRRLVTITPQGRTYLQDRIARLGDPFADFAGGAHGPDLREPMRAVEAAAQQITIDGDPAQVEAAERVLAQARRSLYLILAGDIDDRNGGIRRE